MSSAALLSEWPTREPFHCVHVRLWVVGKGERAAYVVVELGVGHGDKVTGVRNVQEAVVEVLVAGDAVVGELLLAVSHVSVLRSRAFLQIRFLLPRIPTKAQ